MELVNNKNQNEDFLVIGLPNNDMILIKYQKDITSMGAICSSINSNLKYYPDFYILGKQIVDFSKKPEDYNLSSTNKFIEVRDRYANERFDPSKYEDSFSLFVKSLEGKTVTLVGHNDMTIFELKLQIQEKLGSPIKQQRLIFAGQQLEDKRKVSDYMLSKDSNISLVYRLAGGMMNQISGRNGSFGNLELNIINVIPDLE